MKLSGTSPFDDDEATYFAAEILKSDNLRIVAEAIYAVPEEDWEYVEHGTGVRALVASEMIADQMGHESGDVPDELHSWIHEFFDTDDVLINRAKRAVGRVLRDSESREVWKRSPRFREWTMRLNDLLRRLEWR
jgi:hypothetical protein